MTRAIQLAGALGGTALFGAGVLPFLHRDDAPNAWFKVDWPADVPEEAVVELVRHLAASRRPQLVTFEVSAASGRLTYLVGTHGHDAERLRHLFSTHLPEALLERTVRQAAELKHAVQLRLGSRERPLRVNAGPEISRSIAGSLAGATGTTVLQVQVGRRLAPAVVTQDSVGLPTTGRALTQAFAHGLAPLEGKARSELQAKVGDRGFAVVLRAGTTVRDPTAAKGALRGIVGAVRVAEGAGVPLRVRATNAEAVAMARPPRRSGMALNVLELVGLIGWPLGDGAYMGATRIASRRLPIPDAVQGRDRIVADGNHPASRRPLGLAMRDGLMHTHVIGPTGTGKSTLLANLVLQDIGAGRAVVVIEPKGDLIADILDRIPRKRERDVVILDPADAAPVGLNPLTSGSSELASDQVLSVFRGLYPELGPRTTDVLHASLLTLARSGEATLVALPMLLTDTRLRRRLVAGVRDDLALGPFWAWYESLSEAERQQVISPVMNKVRPFLLRERIRHVLGQARPRFDIRQVFTERKILLVPLGKGGLGPEAAGLIGSLVVSQLWQTAQSRASVAPARRHPVSVVIDEFQAFLHLPTDLGDVLAQARGLGVGLTLAHQHLAQLSPDIRAAVLANARSRIAFRLSAEDASVIARTTHLLDAKDFQQLGRYEIYASLVADSNPQPFASATTRPLPKATGSAERIRELSREAYGVSSETIERELHDLWNPTSPAGGAIGSRKRGRPGGGQQ